MAPRRRYAKKKRMVKRKRFVKGGYKKAAAKVNLKRQVHYFSRKVNLGSIVSVGLNTPTLTSLSFKLSNVPGVGDFTSLFDQYKLTFVKLMFKLNQDPSAQTAVNSFYPTMYHSVDHDDVSAPTSIDDMRQHGRTRMSVLKPNRYTVIKIKPSVLYEVARDASLGTTTLAPKWRQWIDMAHTDTVHYGLKYALDNTFNLNPNYSLEVQAQYWFACRDTR